MFLFYKFSVRYSYNDNHCISRPNCLLGAPQWVTSKISRTPNVANQSRQIGKYGALDVDGGFFAKLRTHPVLAACMQSTCARRPGIADSTVQCVSTILGRGSHTVPWHTLTHPQSRPRRAIQHTAHTHDLFIQINKYMPARMFNCINSTATTPLNNYNLNKQPQERENTGHAFLGHFYINGSLSCAALGRPACAVSSTPPRSILPICPQHSSLYLTPSHTHTPNANYVNKSRILLTLDRQRHTPNIQFARSWKCN